MGEKRDEIVDSALAENGRARRDREEELFEMERRRTVRREDERKEWKDSNATDDVGGVLDEKRERAPRDGKDTGRKDGRYQGVCGRRLGAEKNGRPPIVAWRGKKNWCCLCQEKEGV